MNQHRYKSHKHLINNNNADDIAEKIINSQNAGFASKDLLHVLVNLSFSLSYSLTSKKYSNRNKVTSFETLEKTDKLLREITGYIKNVEHGREELTEEKTEYFLEVTKNKLKKYYKIEFKT